MAKENKVQDTERKGFRLFWSEDTRKKFRMLCLKRNTTAQAEIERLVLLEIEKDAKK